MVAGDDVEHGQRKGDRARGDEQRINHFGLSWTGEQKAKASGARGN